MTMPPNAVSPRTEPDRTTPATLPPSEKEAVREQLGRVLASASFRNSKRFPAFLRYTVEHALNSSEPLKERTVGVEVFGREATYDTSQDPVVRMTAAEVRKRLTRYYESPEHRHEIVIGYQPGSYIPDFSSSPHVEQTQSETAARKPNEAVETPRRAWYQRPLLATVLLLVAALSILTLSLRRTTGAKETENAVTRFWHPIMSSSEAVLLCIGDPSSSAQTVERDPSDMTIDEFLESNAVRYIDSVALALLAGELRARGKPFRIRRTMATAFQDLREGAVVLIGGFNNPWALKLGSGLRFTLATDADGSYIRDAERPDHREWRTGTRSRRLKEVSAAFGLITRVRDPATGQSVMTVSGLVFGTRAAAECLLDSRCLESAEQLHDTPWSGKNVQIVVSTTVIEEDSGAPRVVAAHAW